MTRVDIERTVDLVVGEFDLVAPLSVEDTTTVAGWLKDKLPSTKMVEVYHRNTDLVVEVRAVDTRQLLVRKVYPVTA